MVLPNPVMRGIETRKQRPIQRLANQRIESFFDLLNKSKRIAPTAGSHVTQERMPIFIEVS
jgi:hypothetical protein